MLPYKVTSKVVRNISSTTSIADNLRLFHEQGDIIEIRIIGDRKTTSGYFNEAEKAQKEVEKYKAKNNIYFVLNKINPACYLRKNQDILLDYAKETTADKDIERRRWLFIDFDPVRLSGTSSTDEEKEVALARIRQCYKFLKNNGFSEPIQADSGNGYHLLYKIDLPNSEEVKKLIQQFIQALSYMFTDEKVDVDKSVFNASRITKLYGTKAVKGADTPERPHRNSSIQYVPSEINITQESLIKQVADMLPIPEQKQRPKQQYNNNSNATEFNIEDFISRHGIPVLKTDSTKDYVKYVLQSCPFDSDHGKDSAIFQWNDGTLAFRCFHNGCANYSWRDLRLLFEPNAYDKQQEYEQRQTQPKATQQEYQPKEKKSTAELEKQITKLQTSQETDEEVKTILNRCHNVADIPPYDPSKAEIVRTGFEKLDKNVTVEMGQVIFLTGVTGGGKSTALGMIINETLEQGYNVFAYSGELRADKFKSWIDLQLAGRDNCVSFTNSKTQKTFYSVADKSSSLIHKWYDKRFYLYNNRESMKYSDILQTMEVYRKHRKCKVFFLDNFMTIDTSDLSDKELNAHKEFLKSLKNYALTNDVLIYLVIHPAKVKDGIMRLNDIQGSGNMINLCDAVFIVHRVNIAYREYYSKNKNLKMSEEILSSDNVIEVAKDRENGQADLYIPLIFEQASKRLVDKSIQYPKKYGWETKTEAATVSFSINDFEEIDTDEEELPFK